MSRTIFMLLSGLGTLLVGTGLLGTLLGLRARHEGFSNTQIGSIMTVYYLGYVVGTFLIPVLIRRVGHIRTFSALAAIASATVICQGLFPYYPSWLALRLITGVAVVGIYMVAESWLNEQSPKVVRGRIFAIYMMVSLGGLALGQYLIFLSDIQTLSLFAIAAMFITLGLVPIAGTRIHAPQPPQLTPPSMNLNNLFQLSRLSTVGAFMAGIANSTFWGLGAVFAHRAGFSEQSSAIYVSVTIIGGAILQWPIGRWSDRQGRRGMITTVSLFASLFALLLLVSMNLSAPIFFLNTFFYGGMLFSIYSLSVTYMNDRLSSSEQILEATRGLLFVYGAGAIIGPILSGFLMDRFGPGAVPWFSALILGLLSLYGTTRVLFQKPIPTDHLGTFVPMVRTTPIVIEMMPQSEPQGSLDLEEDKEEDEKEGEQEETVMEERDTTEAGSKVTAESEADSEMELESELEPAVGE